MGRRAILVGVVVCTALAQAARAQDFTVGEHVRIGATGETGIVISVAQKMRDGGTFIQIQLDRLPKSHPPSGPWYDSALDQVAPTGEAGAAPAGAPDAPPPGLPPEPPSPANAGPRNGPPAQPPGPQASAKGVAGLCQQAIRGNYPDPDTGTTVRVTFLSFSIGAPRPYEAVYGNDINGARGHVVQARPIRAKYTVLTHYADPNSDDELRTFDAQFMCYQFPGSGEWIAGMTGRAPGGEEAQYIKKH